MNKMKLTISKCQGFTLVEAIISIIIVAGIFLAAMNLFSASHINRLKYTQIATTLECLSQSITDVDNYMTSNTDNTIFQDINTESTSQAERLNLLNEHKDVITSSNQKTSYNRTITVNPSNISNVHTINTNTKLYKIQISLLLNDSVVDSIEIFRSVE